MKYRFECMENGKIIASGNINASHPNQILNSTFSRYNNINRLNLMNDNGERWVFFYSGNVVSKMKKQFRLLNKDEILLVFSGEEMFGSMVEQ